MRDGTSSNEELAKLLGKAINAHNQYMKRATFGQGIDRHLFGLKIAALELGEPTPEIFDEFYDRSVGFHLSTSNVEFPLYTGGFSAMTTDGYGVCYGCDIIVRSKFLTLFHLLKMSYFFFLFCASKLFYYKLLNINAKEFNKIVCVFQLLRGVAATKPMLHFSKIL